MTRAKSKQTNQGDPIAALVRKKIYCTTYMYIILFSQDFICLQFDRIFPFEASLYHQYLVLFIFSGIPVADKRLESQANFKK